MSIVLITTNPSYCQTTISTGSAPLSQKFEGVFSSSPLSSPPDSGDEAHRVSHRLFWNIFPNTSDKIQDPRVYGTGRLKRIYKTDKIYKLYQSHGRRLMSKPPPPPAGTNIPAYSIFSYVFDDPLFSSKNDQLWIYFPKNQRGEGEWKPTARGAIQNFNDVPYQVQWKDGKGASWVKLL